MRTASAPSCADDSDLSESDWTGPRTPGTDMTGSGGKNNTTAFDPLSSYGNEIYQGEVIQMKEPKTTTLSSHQYGINCEA